MNLMTMISHFILYASMLQSQCWFTIFLTISRIHCDSHISATFQYSPIMDFLLTPSRKRELVNIFILLEEHPLPFEAECLKDKFASRDTKLVSSRSWELQQDNNGQMLVECQSVRDILVDIPCRHPTTLRRWITFPIHKIF